MHTRARRISLAFSLAIGFVLFRLVYAFFFSGLWGDRVFLDLPSFQLPGPFRTVSVLGPVSVDGIIRNVELAIPFAAAILAFGILGAFVGPTQLAGLGSRFPRLAWLSTALTVGFGAIVNLAVVVRELANSRRLRGERRSALFVPLLERTVERSGAIGLELARSRPKKVEACQLQINSLFFGSLGPVNLNLDPGSVAVISGATGSGKTSLLACIAGEAFEADDREVDGEIEILGRRVSSFAQSSALSSLVHQHPQQRFVDEVVPQGGVFSADLAGKQTATLSHGEAYRFALDLMVRRSPQIVLIDEPSSALDAAGLELLIAEVAKLAAAGKIVLIAERRPSKWSSVASHSFFLANGELVQGEYVPKPIEVNRKAPIAPASEVSVEISIDELATDRALLGAVELELLAGECVGLTGPNGAGKSTLLHAIAVAEEVSVSTHGNRFAGFAPAQIALVPDRVSNFFVTDALDRELRRADKIAGAATGLTRLTLESILGRDVESDLKTHPLDLSVGTQLTLATAMQLSHKPTMLLLDEPAQGLDPKARVMMAETIRCVQETGCSILFATHDKEFALLVANRVLEIHGSRLHQIGEEAQL